MRYITAPVLLLPTAALAQIIGVAPKDQQLYTPDSDNKWHCLSNPDIVLDFKQINDDYCDCPDGSDEPGTNACPNNLFYCENKGHIPGYIKSSLVNDGKCDYLACCDGSDEWNTPVECPNRCEEIHEQYEKEFKLKQKVYKIGADKAQKTVRAAKRLREKLEGELTAEKAVFEFIDKELSKHVQESHELAKKEKNGKVDKSLVSLKAKLGNTFDVLVQNKQNLDTLVTIITNLVNTFNANLNDGAVSLTVDRFKVHQDHYADAYDSDKGVDVKATKEKVLNYFNDDSEKTTGNFPSILNELETSYNTNKLINERVNDLEVILNYLIENYNPNFNDPNVKEAVQQFQDYASNKPRGSVSDQNIEEIKSDSEKVKAQIEEAKAKQAKEQQKQQKQQEQKPIADFVEVEDKADILSRLRYKFRELVDDFLGVAPPKPKAKPLPSKDENLQAVNELQQTHDEAVKRISDLENELARDLGPNDILRPLEDISFSGKIGEYDYEVYFLKDIHQRGQNNHNVKIGTFDHYNIDEIDEQNLQWKLFYTNGAKCWNGPKRSAVVTITCGESNELLSVSEPEKCEYHFRVKAPIGCKI